MLVGGLEDLVPGCDVFVSMRVAALRETRRHESAHLDGLIHVVVAEEAVAAEGGAMAADLLSEMGQAALQASYTRELEEDADRVAVELMNRAGLKAATFTDLLYRIEKRYGTLPEEDETDEAGQDGESEHRESFSFPDMMATHPSTPDRARMVRELAALYDTKVGKVDTELLSARIDQLPDVAVGVCSGDGDAYPWFLHRRGPDRRGVYALFKKPV